MNPTILSEHSPQEWISGLKNADQQIIREFYEDEKRPFFLWARRYFRRNSDAVSDTFQETMLAFLRAARSGRLDVCSSCQKLHAYFFSLGRRIARRRLAEQAQRVDLTPEFYDLPDEQEKAVNPERERKLVRALRRLPQLEQQLLYLHYVDNLSLPVTAAQTGLRTDEVLPRLRRARLALREAFQMERD